MGKLKATKQYTSEMTDHYGVALTVTSDPTKGDTGRVLINDTQAVAGVAIQDSRINPSKKQCGDMANEAESLASELGSEEKKMTGGEIYAIGN